MLTKAEELRATFTNLNEEDMRALVLLKLIDKFTTESELKVLAYALRHDEVIRTRRAASWIAAQDEARAKNPDPDWNDSEAWFHISDSDFTALDVVSAMSAEERAALRARIG